jgi:hypothetical protein
MLIELTLLGGGVMAYWTKRNKRKNKSTAESKVLPQKAKPKGFSHQNCYMISKPRFWAMNVSNNN